MVAELSIVRPIAMTLEEDTMSMSSDQHEGLAAPHTPAASAMESRLTSRRLSYKRSLTSLNISPEEFAHMLEQDVHYFAPLAQNRKHVQFVKLHMNGTSNSRRFIHVHLWWARLLGPNYPISDDMLQGRVWKHLRCTCGEGILDTRGHRRPANPLQVCISPAHYSLDHGADLLAMIREDAQNLCDEVVISDEQAMDFIARLRALLAENPDLDTLLTFIRRECPVFTFGPTGPQVSSPRTERARGKAAKHSSTATPSTTAALSDSDVASILSSSLPVSSTSGAQALLLAAQLISGEVLPGPTQSSPRKNITTTTTVSSPTPAPTVAPSPQSSPRTKRAFDSDGSDDDFVPPRSVASPAARHSVTYHHQYSLLHRSPLARRAAAAAAAAAATTTTTAATPTRTTTTTRTTTAVVPQRDEGEHDGDIDSEDEGRLVIADTVADKSVPTHVNTMKKEVDAEDVITLTKQLSVDNDPLTLATTATNAIATTTNSPYTWATSASTARTHAAVPLTTTAANIVTTTPPLAQTGPTTMSAEAMQQQQRVLYQQYQQYVAENTTLPPQPTPTTTPYPPLFYVMMPVQSLDADGKPTQTWALVPVHAGDATAAMPPVSV